MALGCFLRFLSCFSLILALHPTCHATDARVTSSRNSSNAPVVIADLDCSDSCGNAFERALRHELENANVIRLNHSTPSHSIEQLCDVIAEQDAHLLFALTADASVFSTVSRLLALPFVSFSLHRREALIEASKPCWFPRNDH